MTAIRYTAGVFVLLVLAAVGCGGRENGALPLGPSALRHPSGSAGRLHVSTTANQPWAWCAESPPPFGGTETVNCILDVGQHAFTQVKVPVDEADNPSPSPQDSCGSVAWSLGTPNPNVSITLTTPAPTSSVCTRLDTITVTAQHLANGTVTPSPGALLYHAMAVGTNQESGSGSGEEGGQQNGTQTQMPGPGHYNNYGVAMLQFNIYVYAPPALQITDLYIPNNPVINSPAASPSPLMIGQEVGFSALATGGRFTTETGTWPGTVTFTIDPTPAATNVVASYAPCACTSVPSPEPLGTLTEPGLGSNTTPALNMYFLTPGTKTVTASGYVQLMAFQPQGDNAIGPSQLETATVHYPIQTVTYSASATTTAHGTQVGWYGQGGAGGFNESANCNNAVPPATPAPGPSGINYVLALHLGNACVPHGIGWKYSVTAPEVGAGVIYIAQLTSGTVTLSNSHYTYQNSTNGFVLDGTYPYPGGEATPAPVGAGGKATLNGALDAPARPLGLANGTGSCTMVTRSDNFEDYFIYQANSPRSGRPSIPVTLATMTWAWGGTASSSDGGSTWTGSSPTSPPTSISAIGSTLLPFWVTIAQANPLPSPDPCATPTPSPTATPT